MVIGPVRGPLIELHWTCAVAKWRGVSSEDEGLRNYLFGASRVSFARWLVEELGELQGGSCFAFGSGLGRQRKVDHFTA